MAKTTTGNLIPSTSNTPLDARSRIAALADVASIENPMLGGIFYCIETGKHYRITSLKAKNIGALTVENAAVNTYEEIPEILTVNSLSGRMTAAETAIGTKAAASDVTALAGRMTTAEGTISEHTTAISGKASATDVTALAGRVTSAETAIGTKASVSDLTALSGRVTSAEGAISDHTTAISGKANQSDLSALSGRVTTAEGTIAEHTTAIGTKAAVSDLTALTGRVTAAEGTIADHTTAIGTKASASDLTALENRVTVAETAISGKADQSDLSGLSDLSARVTTAEGTIADHTTAIAGKASASDVTALTGRVSDAETAIAGKAAASDVTALTGRVTTAEGTIADHTTAIAGKAAASDVTALAGRVSDAETALAGKSDQSDLSDLSDRVSSAESALANKAAAADVTALAGRMTAAETAISGKAAASDLNILAGTLSTLETEARSAWDTAIGQIFGVSNIRGTYAAEIIGYEEDNGNYILILSPDNEDLDLSKFAPGDTVTLSLCTGITSTDPETNEETTAYTLTEAEIASVDGTNKKIYLTASLYQGDIDSTDQIGYEKRTVSGYTGSATGGPSAYRVTLSGAGSDDDLRVGRKIYTRAGTGALTANSIAGTSGNYLYLSSAAAGTNAIYLGPSNVYLSNGKPEEEDNTIVCAGEYNFVSGEANSVSGSYNTVVGIGSEASGSDNIVVGDFSLARGEGNRVSGGASLAIGTSNIVSDSMSTVIGQGNKLLYQGQFALGSGNTLTAVNAFAFGWQNKMSGYGTISVGTLNTVSGKNSIAVGYRNTVAAESAYVIGRYANVEKSIENKNALIVHGGSMSDNGTALAVRSLKAVENPSYVQGGTEDEYIEETAFSTEYRGRLKAVTKTISTVGTIELDHDQYARWELTGTGAVTLTLANWQDGDRGEVVIDTAKQTFSIPASWIVPDSVWDAWTETPGIYCMEIRKEGGAVFAHAAVPFNAGGSSSSGEWTIGQNGNWYHDGIDTGNPSRGEKGDAPVRGIDYWTAADIASIKNYVTTAILNGSW